MTGFEIVAGVAALVSAGVGAYGAVQQAQAQQQAANYNAAAARQNAQVSIENAGIVRAQAALEAQQNDRLTYQRLGAIRAAAGASGTASAGSVLDVLGDQAAQSELEHQQILYKGELGVRSHLNQARGYTNTAALDVMGGEQAMQAGYLRAGNDLLGGASGAMNTYNKQQSLKRTN